MDIEMFIAVIHVATLHREWQKVAEANQASALYLNLEVEGKEPLVLLVSSGAGRRTVWAHKAQGWVFLGSSSDWSGALQRHLGRRAEVTIIQARKAWVEFAEEGAPPALVDVTEEEVELV